MLLMDPMVFKSFKNNRTGVVTFLKESAAVINNIFLNILILWMFLYCGLILFQILGVLSLKYAFVNF